MIIDNIEVSLSIVIPLFNEEENVFPLYQGLMVVLKSIACKYEIIFINDASTDKTALKLDELASQNKLVKVINFKRNFGQTAAMMAGINFSSNDIIIPMDGDLQNDPQDIPILLAKLNEGYDVCSGWRKDRKDNSLKRNLPSKIANFLISRISGVHLHDYGCSLKAYKRNVIEGVKLYGEMHRFIPIYAVWQGAKVTEVPVTHHARKHGESKYGINRTFKVILDLIVIKFLEQHAQKPIYIFGGFGIFSICLSVLSFFLMIYLKYWRETTFIRTPLPLLTILFFMLGIISILLGLIAELLNRTYYESQNKPVYLIKNLKNIEVVNK
jgi:glycosyltransferase involved in cell wall biosynthesis